MSRLRYTPPGMTRDPHSARSVEVSHRAIVRLALPMTLANLSTPLLGLADATVIGRLGQADLLGAIAAAAIVFDFVFWGFGFLRLGTAALVAQSFGAGDPVEERATVLRALGTAVLLGAAIIALQRPVATIAFTLLDASPAVTEAARRYYDIRVWAAPFALLNYAVLGAVIGRGRTDLGLALQVLINLLNIAFNVVLVTRFGLGVRGSAFGTLAAEGIGTVAGLTVLLRLHGVADLPWKGLGEAGRLRRTLGINRDIMIRSVALLAAFVFFTARGARGGDLVLAANAVLINLFLVTSYCLDGFATAAEQMCGQSLGAGDARRFRQAARLSAFWSLAFAAVASGLALLFGGAFIDAVTTNGDVRSLARAFLPFAALTPLAGALAFAFDGVFTGATWTRDMRNLMLVALALYFAVFLASRPLGNTGLWLALLSFLAARGALQLWRYQALVRDTFPPQVSTAR